MMTRYSSAVFKEHTGDDSNSTYEEQGKQKTVGVIVTQFTSVEQKYVESTHE